MAVAAPTGGRPRLQCRGATHAGRDRRLPCLMRFNPKANIGGGRVTDVRGGGGGGGGMGNIPIGGITGGGIGGGSRIGGGMRIR